MISQLAKNTKNDNFGMNDDDWDAYDNDEEDNDSDDGDDEDYGDE